MRLERGQKWVGGWERVGWEDVGCWDRGKWEKKGKISAGIM